MSLQIELDKEKLSLLKNFDSVFSGEEFSEEFKTEMNLKLEAIVEATAAEVIEQLTEQADAIIAQEVDSLSEEFTKFKEAFYEEATEKVNSYLKEASENIISENKSQIVESHYTDTLSKMIVGIKEIMESNGIEIDTEAASKKKIEELSEQIDSLEETLAQTIKSKRILEEQTDDLKKKMVIEGVSSELPLSTKSRFVNLCETLSYTSIEDFERKAKTLVEGFIEEEPTQTSSLEEAPLVNLINEEVKQEKKAMTKGELMLSLSKNGKQ